jgi:Na+-driven multidrug efflux pump
MENISFPRWAAPLAGAGAGAILGLRAARRDGQGIKPEWVIGSTVLGLLAGCVVWLLERPDAGPAPAAGDARDGSVRDLSQPGSRVRAVAGAVLALLSIVLVCVPVAGLALAAVAVLATRKDQRWPWAVSTVAVLLSAGLNIAYLLAVVLAGP